MALLGGSESDHIAAIVELDIVLTAHLDTLNGIVKAIQRQRQSSLSLDTAGLAEVVNLIEVVGIAGLLGNTCLLYTSPSPRGRTRSRMPSSA